MVREISILFSVIFNLILVYYCLKKFKKNPLSFDVIMYFLYLIFYYIPVLDYIYDCGLFSNEFLELNGYPGDIETAVKFNIISLVITACFILGFRVRFTFGKRGSTNLWMREVGDDFNINIKNLTIIKLVLLVALFLVVFSAYRNYQYGLKNFFSMARKEAYTNSLQTELVVIIPTILLSLEFIQEIKTCGRIKSKLYAYIILLLAMTITRGQRRELINDVIFVALLLIYAKTQKYYSLNNILANKKIRKYIIVLGIIIAILIPVTWYLRVYSTQLQYGNIVNPFQYRGWLELLFGSSSSGFQTSLILDGYKKDYGLPFLASIKLMLSYFVPRSLIGSKPMVLTRYVQQGLNTSGNLSVFYINDIWFNFYYLSPIISVGFGILISSILKGIDSSKNLFKRITKYVLFSKVITLFKNGYTGYFFGIIIFAVLWKCIEKVTTKKNKKQGEISDSNNR